MEGAKDHLHKLIDENENPELLDVITDILEQHRSADTIWKSLSEEEKKRTLLAEEETSYPLKQVSQGEMIRRNKQWLK